ncbi:hypothetical protein [Paraglaciecola aestuariivivens]
MSDDVKFGWHSWHEAEVDAEQPHLKLTYCANDQSKQIEAAIVGEWDTGKQCFPFQLTTDDPEAIAHAVESTNTAFNQYLNFDTQKQPAKAWAYFCFKSQQDFFIGNVQWQFIIPKAQSFSYQLNEVIQDDGQNFGYINWCEVNELDTHREHFKLFYAVDGSQYQHVATLGYWDWKLETFPVLFLSSQHCVVAKVKENLDYYLNTLPSERNEKADTDFAKIWMELKKHSGSTAIWYQQILWRHYKK